MFDPNIKFTNKTWPSAWLHRLRSAALGKGAACTDFLSTLVLSRVSLSQDSCVLNPAKRRRFGPNAARCTALARPTPCNLGLVPQNVEAAAHQAVYDAKQDQGARRPENDFDTVVLPE